MKELGLPSKAMLNRNIKNRREEYVHKTNIIISKGARKYLNEMIIKRLVQEDIKKNEPKYCISVRSDSNTKSNNERKYYLAKCKLEPLLIIRHLELLGQTRHIRDKSAKIKDCEYNFNIFYNKNIKDIDLKPSMECPNKPIHSMKYSKAILIKSKDNKNRFDVEAFIRSNSNLNRLLINHFRAEENRSDFQKFIASYHKMFYKFKIEPNNYITVILDIVNIFSKGIFGNAEVINGAIDYYQKLLKIINSDESPSEFARILVCLGDLYHLCFDQNSINLEMAIYIYAKAIRLIDPMIYPDYFTIASDKFESSCKKMFREDQSIDYRKIIKMIRNDEIFKMIRRATKIEIPDECKIDNQITTSIQIVINKTVNKNLIKLAELIADDNQKNLSVMILIAATRLETNENWRLMKVPIGDDSSCISFSLNPKEVGKGIIDFDIFYKSVIIGHIRGKTEIKDR